ncbi:MAG: ABC transporter permease subunit [Kaiparowitsia implicata GSE-PSE-MK54-09C]|jgi:general L-amino acid transport system permease protein|nr:ABC transporter permease subunit [Kaiparowitsia implicata GSE-PSE-MK54-09C]
MTQTSDRNIEKIPLWRDERIIKIVLQAVVLIIVLGVLVLLFSNALTALARQGRQFNFAFLRNSAGFNIGESIVSYGPQNSYTWALVVGLINTLRVIFVGFVLTTIVGVIAGVASFSSNWLLKKISAVYVELVRNTPLLLQLFVWYFGVVLAFTGTGEAPTNLFNFLYISKRQGGGIAIPWPPGVLMTWVSLALLVLGAIAALFIWRWRIRIMEEQGASGKPQLIALAVLGFVALLLFFVGLGWEFPQLNATGGVSGGLSMSLEYAAILLGLVFYTGAFIAEIVRAGIEAVSRGQWEAGKALGLQPGLLMRLVVFPQALRVIIPSLNSQYMNLAKNSSLALAIGYPDIYSTAQTTFNQTGRPIEVFIIIAGTYLIINLVISVFMNTLNQMVQVKER